MSHVLRTHRRRLVAGLTPILLALGALPLLAPTCGGGAEGPRTFARSSLIIPMDLCYQHQTDGTGTAYQPAAGCPQAPDGGDVIKAYGLVYQLIRNDVAVYWIIDQQKTKVTDLDLSIQYDGGFPVLLYDWATGKPGNAPSQSNLVKYMGGPFVVDGSDYAKASAVLQRYKSTFGAVNVHVSNVAFRGYAKKTMAGGWSAGGAVPPKIALLDIGSGNLQNTTPLRVNDPKNAQPVIEGYLTKAGLGGGTYGGAAAGPHGEIYDKLGIDDFQPAAGATGPEAWKTSRFAQNGYQVLWVPHWVAPGSCSNFSSSANCLASLYPADKIQQVLRTIGAWVGAGNDVFAECAGLGSFEGAYTATGTSPSFDYKEGDPSTRFQTNGGVRFNVDVNASQSGRQMPSTAALLGSFGSPLMQMGDFPFVPVTGAIEDYQPHGTPYLSGVERLIAASTPNFETWDFFTVRPSTVSNGRGTSVYLAGHSYSGTQGTFQVAGSRLVLNTLFNLGAGCTASGVSCDTGQLGVCAKGVLQCGPDGEQVCAQAATAGTEICNGLDDDCDGLVDEGLEQACWDGPAAGRGKGLCRDGIRACVRNADGSYGMSACGNQTLPAPELCNDLDDDCDGAVDEDLKQACYLGPQGTMGVGICKAGQQACSAGAWGECRTCPAGMAPTDPGYADCQVLPRDEVCAAGMAVDENCDGFVNESSGEGCGTCAPSATVECYSGPAGTLGHANSVCRTGTQTCSATHQWGPCIGESLPRTELCDPDGVDEDCDGESNEGCGCRWYSSGGAGPETQACYGGPAETRGVGACRDGAQLCVQPGTFDETCTGQILPSVERCDAIDNDCDGAADENPEALCSPGFLCEHGVCVPSRCGTEQGCPEGYSCELTSGTCRREANGCGGVTCPDGQACEYGACVDRCPTDPADPRYVHCGEGSFCADGACVGGSCYFAGCPAGEVCREGACAVDLCAGLSCPTGTFCRAEPGATDPSCVQACTFVACPSGEKCGADGFCEPDACAGVTCGPNDRCVAGACVADPCAGVGCGTGQVCDEGVCVDDPCANVVCPAGRCLAGQCYAVGNPNASEAPLNPEEAGGCGCGSGDGASFAAVLLLLALPLARRRRVAAAVAARTSRGGIALLLVAAALLGSACTKEKDDPPFDPASCGPIGRIACDGETRCIDAWEDPAHCGGCGNVCAEGSVCVDQVCGPAVAVAPFVRAVSPASADKGQLAPVTVDVTGERFAPGATVRAVSAAGSETLETTFVDAGHLRLQLDLAERGETALFLRVVNPDHVISNARRFDVVTPGPVLAAVTPSQPLAGEVTPLLVTGTGLVPASRCLISGPVLTERDLPSVLGPGGLTCTLDAAALSPGAGFRIKVENPATPAPLVSNELPFEVVSKVPVLEAVSPSVGAASAVVAITVSGSGFDVTSRVLFDGTPLATAYVDATQLYVAQLTLPAADCGQATCPHTLQVRSGAGDPYKFSGTRTFTVGAAGPAVVGLAPGSAYRGNPGVTLTFTGSAFPSGTLLQLQPPGGTFDAGTACTVSGGTSASASVSLAGKPEGFWLARLAFPSLGNSTSAAFTFRVLSNTPILQGADVRGAAQGEPSVPVVITATNLRPLPAFTGPDKGVRVRFNGASIVPTVNVTSAAAGTGTVTATLSTVGLATGTYSIQLANPDGTSAGTSSLSNALSFSVTPGAPTLATVCLASSPAGPCPRPEMRQQEPRVAIRLTGTNFARPDAAGNGGSTVHISSAEIGLADFVIPSADVTVTSASEIVVSLDTRIAVPAAYSVAVWNPGGPTPPQKSGVLANALVVLP